MTSHTQTQVDLLVWEEHQTSLGEKGSQTLDKGMVEEQNQEIVTQDIKMEDIVTEAKAEKEGEEMEQKELESTTMGVQEDPENTAGRPNVLGDLL